jgi:hypothetical protein
MPASRIAGFARDPSAPTGRAEAGGDPRSEPAIQLLEYEGHPGSYGIRFCYYNLSGRFQRSPMMIDGEDTFEGLRNALKETPKLRAMLRNLVA